jgi:hypothetical protein
VDNCEKLVRVEALKRQLMKLRTYALTLSVLGVLSVFILVRALRHWDVLMADESTTEGNYYYICLLLGTIGITLCVRGAVDIYKDQRPLNKELDALLGIEQDAQKRPIDSSAS